MIIYKWLAYYSTCFSCIYHITGHCHFMDIYYGYAILPHVPWYTRIPLYQILSLLHCHQYQPIDTLDTVLHINMYYTKYYYFMYIYHHYTYTDTHDIILCSWLLIYGYSTPSFHMSSNRNLNISNEKFSCNRNTGLLM